MRHTQWVQRVVNCTEDIPLVGAPCWLQKIHILIVGVGRGGQEALALLGPHYFQMCELWLPIVDQGKFCIATSSTWDTFLVRCLGKDNWNNVETCSEVFQVRYTELTLYCQLLLYGFTILLQPLKVSETCNGCEESDNRMFFASGNHCKQQMQGTSAHEHDSTSLVQAWMKSATQHTSFPAGMRNDKFRKQYLWWCSYHLCVPLASGCGKCFVGDTVPLQVIWQSGINILHQAHSAVPSDYINKSHRTIPEVSWKAFAPDIALNLQNSIQNITIVVIPYTIFYHSGPLFVAHSIGVCLQYLQDDGLTGITYCTYTGYIL